MTTFSFEIIDKCIHLVTFSEGNLSMRTFPQTYMEAKKLHMQLGDCMDEMWKEDEDENN